MNKYIINAIILDQDEVFFNLCIDASSEKEAINFLNFNYSVINILIIALLIF